MVQSREQRLPIFKSAGRVGDPAGGAGSCRLQHDPRILRIKTSQPRGPEVSCVPSPGHVHGGLPAAGETVAAQGIRCAVPRRVCCVCRAVDCRELLSWEQVIHANTTSVWGAVEHGSGCVLHSMQVGREQSTTTPHPRTGPAPVFSLYGNPGMVCLIPRHEPRGRYPVPWAT